VTVGRWVLWVWVRECVYVRVGACLCVDA